MRPTLQMPVMTAVEELFSRAEAVTPMRQYHALFTLFALAKGAVVSGDKALLERCKAHLDKYPDEIDHPGYSFELYRIGGVAKAYLFYKGEYDGISDMIREYAEETYNALRSTDGVICYKKPGPWKWIWVDAITAVAPFMLFAGLALSEERYVDFAAEQTILMYDALVDRDCGLVHQVRGRYDDDEFRCSEDHWSRGNGWMMVAFAELIEHLPKESRYYSEVVSRYKAFCESIVKYQSMRGLWRQEMTVEGSWEESSGTGLLAYGIGVGVRMGILEDEKYKVSFKNALSGLANHCISENYNTYNSCESNSFPGDGEDQGTIHAYICLPKSFRNEPHSFGTIMIALVEAYSNGMTEIEKYKQLYHTLDE